MSERRENFMEIYLNDLQGKEPPKKADCNVKPQRNRRGRRMARLRELGVCLRADDSEALRTPLYGADVLGVLAA
jgi:hypothetical protein